MSVSRLAALAAICAVVVACTESPSQSVDSNLLVAAAASGPVIGSASGSGHALCSFPVEAGGMGCGPSDELRTFSFNAQLRADGSVSGRAQGRDRGFGTGGQVDILCLRFLSENRAAMLGVFTHVTGTPKVPAGALPPVVGRVVIFAVEDHGQGRAAAPDLITHLLPLADDDPLIPLFCAGQVDGLVDGLLPFFFFEAVRGNIQVRAPAAG